MVVGDETRRVVPYAHDETLESRHPSRPHPQHAHPSLRLPLLQGRSTAATMAGTRPHAGALRLLRGARRVEPRAPGAPPEGAKEVLLALAVKAVQAANQPREVLLPIIPPKSMRVGRVGVESESLSRLICSKNGCLLTKWQKLLPSSLASRLGPDRDLKCQLFRPPHDVVA